MSSDFIFDFKCCKTSIWPRHLTSEMAPNKLALRLESSRLMNLLIATNKNNKNVYYIKSVNSMWRISHFFVVDDPVQPPVHYLLCANWNESNHLNSANLLFQAYWMEGEVSIGRGHSRSTYVKNQRFLTPSLLLFILFWATIPSPMFAVRSLFLIKHLPPITTARNVFHKCLICDRTIKLR